MGYKFILSLVTYFFFIQVAIFSFEDFNISQQKKRFIDGEASLINIKEQKMADKLFNIILRIKKTKISKQKKEGIERKNWDNSLIKIKDLIELNPESQVGQLVLAIMSNLSYFEGFIYRLRPIISSIDSAHLFSLYQLRKFKQLRKTRSEFWDILFEILTYPNPNKVILDHKGTFNKVEELQDWLMDKLFPKIVKSIKKIEKIADKYRLSDTIFLMDSRMGIDGKWDKLYRDEIYRKKIVGATHLQGFISKLYKWIGISYYTMAFHLDDLGGFLNLIGEKIYNIKKGTYLNRWSYLNNIQYMTAQSLYKMLTQGSFSLKRSKLFTLREKAKEKIIFTYGGEKESFENMLDVSRVFLKRSLEREVLYYKGMNILAFKKGNTSRYIVEPKKYIASFDLRGHKNREFILEEMLTLLKRNDAIEIKDQIYKQSFFVNGSVLFNLKKVADLRAFLPVQFVETWEKIPMKVSLKASMVNGLRKIFNTKVFSTQPILNYKTNYRINYKYGNPINWNNNSFSDLFPDTKEMKRKDQLFLYFNQLKQQPSLKLIWLWVKPFVLI